MRINKFLCFTILILSISFLTGSESRGEDDMLGGENLAEIKMSYRLEEAYSPYKYIQVEVSGKGEAVLEYELYADEISAGNQPRSGVIKFQVQPELIQKLLRLYLKADFFNVEVNDSNRDEIVVTDVGTTTLSLNYAGKKRSLSYGYIEDDPFQELIKLYWDIITDYLPK